NRAALGSAIATQLGPSARTVATLRPQAFPDVDLLSLVRSNGESFGDGNPVVASSSAVRSALAGRGATGLAADLLVAAQPVLPRSSGFALVLGKRLDLSSPAAGVPSGTSVELVSS